MFVTAAARSLKQGVIISSSRAMSTKVAVLGAGGGIGQPLSMLLKLSPLIDELACYDIVGTPGVAADLSHVRFYFILFYFICCLSNTYIRLIRIHGDE